MKGEGALFCIGSARVLQYEDVKALFVKQGTLLYGKYVELHSAHEGFKTRCPKALLFYEKCKNCTLLYMESAKSAIFCMKSAKSALFCMKSAKLLFNMKI